MPKLARTDLWSLEEYAEKRLQYRQLVMEHKKNRQTSLGEHARLLFEDEITIRYQIQEMLRIEKIFEVQEIQQELDAYNPLIPDGTNWKATFMLEFPDEEDRKTQLANLKGIENSVWVQASGFDKVYAIADEDLERENQEKTSSVHFLRFELSPEMLKSVRGGTDITVGIDHKHLPIEGIHLAEEIRNSLTNDLDNAP